MPRLSPAGPLAHLPTIQDQAYRHQGGIILGFLLWKPGLVSHPLGLSRELALTIQLMSSRMTFRACSKDPAPVALFGLPPWLLAPLLLALGLLYPLARGGSTKIATLVGELHAPLRLPRHQQDP